MAFRFIHSADVHLDSPLRSLALRNSELAELVSNATRRAFADMVELCLSEKVDALVLAGDLYDGDQTSMKTARFLAEQLRKLNEAGIKVFIVRGNHDALSRITKELELPDNVKVFSARAEALPLPRDNAPPVVVHGLSFAKPHAPESLLPKYRPAVEGAANIGIMHTSLGGSAGHDPYAPCSLVELQATGFSYWALGHVHARSVYEGECTVVMPGMPQGRDIGESGPKSVTVVTIKNDLSVQVEERATSIAQFERVEVDATGIEDWPTLIAETGNALETARDAADAEHLVARVGIFGQTPLTWRIRSDRDLLFEEASLRASEIGYCWVEKLETSCRLPEAPESDSGNPVAEVRRIIASEVAVSDAFLHEARRKAEELRRQLPAGCRSMLGSTEEELDALLTELIAEGSEDVIARLQAGVGQDSK